MDVYAAAQLFGELFFVFLDCQCQAVEGEDVDFVAFLQNRVAVGNRAPDFARHADFAAAYATRTIGMAAGRIEPVAVAS